MNFASPGLGSTTFIAGALFKDAAKIDVVHVPYKGAPEANMSVVRGDSQMLFHAGQHGGRTGAVRQGARAGVATDKRVASMPDVPTLQEAGLPGFVYESWFGLMAPAGTPAGIIEKINKDVDRWAAGQVPAGSHGKAGRRCRVTSTPKQFDETIKSDTARYTKMFQDAGTRSKIGDFISDTIGFTRRAAHAVRRFFVRVVWSDYNLELS